MRGNWVIFKGSSPLLEQKSSFGTVKHRQDACATKGINWEHSRFFANLCFVPEGQMEIAHRFIGGTIG